MTREPDRKIILEDGQEYYGYSFGSTRDQILEIVFNTSMVGYQEILSDPSYTDQMVVMTYPWIGNYGMAEEDYETEIPTIGALVVREYNEEPSNYRSVKTLGEVMKQYGISGIYGVDTRKLNRSIRDYGSRKALLTHAGTALEEGIRKLANYTMPVNAVSRVSCRGPWETGENTARWHVVAIDCGIKHSIIRSLTKRGCRVTIVPWNTPAEKILSCHPDGVLISNGPGDPMEIPETIGIIQRLIGRLPIFGICLGYQILSLAYGARTYKLKFGHRGGNHPVKDLETGKIEITSQNHSYAVNAESLQNTPLVITHLNLLDGTVEGVKCETDQAFGVQYHPESAPGPQDSTYLFDRFIQRMEGNKVHA